MPKISQLPAASSVGASDLFAIVQGATTKKATQSLVLANVQSNIQITEAQVTNLTTDLAGKLAVAANLSDVQSAATSRTNLGIGASGTHADTFFLQTLNNLSDLNSAATARTNLGLGSAAVVNVPISATNGGTGVSDPTAHTIPIAQGASAFTVVGPLTNGQLVVGSTGVDPVAAVITPGAGISISNGPGTITISASGSGPFSWTEVTGTTQSMSTNAGYIANNAGTVTLTLPASSAIGDELFVIGKGAGGWSIAQGASQQIHIGSVASTAGAGGSVASTNQYDSLYMVCITANTIWTTVGGPQSAGLTIV